MSEQNKIDELQIVISSTDEGKVLDKIDRLIKYLNKLEGTSKGSKGSKQLETIADEADKANDQIKAVDSALTEMGGKGSRSGSGGIKPFSAMNDGLKDISETASKTAKSVEAISFDQAKEMAGSLSKLEIKQEELNNAIKNYQNLLNSGASQDKLDTARLKVNKLQSAYESLAQQQERSQQKQARALEREAMAQERLNERQRKALQQKAVMQEKEAQRNAFAQRDASISPNMATALVKTASKADLLRAKVNEATENVRNLMVEGKGGSQLASAIEKAQDAQAKYNAELRKTSATAMGRSFNEIKKKVAEVVKETEKARNTLKSIGKTVGSPFLTPFSQAKKLVGGLGGEITRLMKNFKRVALYRALRESVRMVTEGIRTGIDNAYQWSLVMEQTFGDGVKSATQFRKSMDSLATSSLYLKNSLGAMAMPLINMVAPAVDAVIEKLVSLFNVINRLFATISGATTWTRALKYPKSYGEALDDAGRSAGKLKDELITILGIDEINPMEGAKDPTGRGSGAGALADDYGSMFEEVALESDKVSDFLGELFDPLKKAWDTKGEAVMKAFDTALSGINTLVKSVGSSFWEVWTNGTGQKTVEHLLGILEGILLTVGNIADAFARGWNTDNLGTKIIQHLWDMLNDILGMWEDISLATSEWAKGINFEPAIRSFENLTSKLEPLVKLVTEGLAWAWKNVLLPFGKWTIEKGLPVVLDLLAEAIDFVRLNIEMAKPSLEFMWKNFLQPLASWTGGEVIQFLTDFKDTLHDINAVLSGDMSLNTALDNLIERITKKIKELIPRLHVLSKVMRGDFYGAWKLIEQYRKELGIEAFASEVESVASTFSDINGLIGIENGVKLPVIAEVQSVDDQIKKEDKKLSGFAGGLTGKIAKDKGFDPTLGGLLGGVTGGLTKEKGFNNNLGGLKGGVTGNLNKEKGFNPSVGGLTATFSNKDTDKKFDNKFNSVANFVDRTVDKKKVPTVWGGWVAEFVKRRKDDATMPTVWGGWTALFVKRKKDNNELPTVWGGWTAKFDDRKIGFDTSLKMTAKITKFNADKNTPIEVGGSIKGYVAEKGGAFYNGMWHNIPQYASGGLPNHGSMFIAGEAGAELVGHIGGHTEVLNQSQMASALAEGMAPQAQLLQQLVSIGEQILAEQGDRNVVVSTSAIAEGFQRMNRREGRTVVPVGV